MLSVVIAILGLIHFLIFLLSILFFVIIYKKEKYQKIDLIKFLFTIFSVSVFSFFLVNHLTFIADSAQLLHAILISMLPISQLSILLLSYPLIKFLNDNEKYASYFFGIMASIFLTLILVITLGETYWDLLGKNIYGR